MATDNRYTWRFRIVLIILSLAAFALIWRMVDLMVIKRQFLVNQGDARMVRVVKTQAYRGMITDRDGNPLAISTPVNAAWADPQSIENVSKKTLKQLATILQMSSKTLSKRLKNKSREFVYLKRQLSPVQSAEIQALNIPGVFLKREYRRYYPEGEVTAHILGLTNIDDHGQEGLELAYNAQLEGISGLKRVIKDRMGHIVEEVNQLREPKPGQNITLSIDRRIQYLAYRYLKEGYSTSKAKGASAVVLDIPTGEILAMVNLPSFNPNDRPKTHDGRFRNRAVTDVFEPGSTIKPFAVAVGLDSGKYTPDTIIDTGVGWMRVGNNIVRDEHFKGKLSVTKILQISSNVGVSKIILSLPLDSLYQKLDSLGLGHITESGFPGESAGVLQLPRVWRPFSVATMSFGYGLSVTALQLAKLYATLGNEGIEKPVSFLKNANPPKGKQVMQAKTADQILRMLETVVEPGGTATKARVAGYWVAGKTGTSRIVGPHGYMRHHHNAVFAGVAPASDPKIVVVVYVHDPQGKSYYAGQVAAPIFAKIMAGTLRILNIVPDHLGSAQR
jgi:cell division protein FtsI (penicillin-binding protein 3)